MGVYSIKPAFQRSLLPLEDALVANGVHPDAITLPARGILSAGLMRLDRTKWNHYDAQDATSNVIFASEMR